MAQILDLGKIRFQFKGEWSSATEYQFNDVVAYKGNTYVYISTAKTTNTVTSNTQFWGRMSNGFDFTGAYAGGTTYGYGSTVRYGGHLYLYTNAVASAGNLPTNATYWTLLIYGWNFQGAWSSSTAYKIGESITHGGIAYVAVQDSTNQNPDNNATYWSTLVQGLQFEGTYNNSTAYQKNDLVNYGSNTYIALTNTTGNLPTNSTYWNLLIGGFNFRSAWSSSTAYKVGDSVALGGNVYVALLDSTNQNPDANPTYWSTIIQGIQYEGAYSGATAYQKNDLVTYGSNTYIALSNTVGNLPTNATYWSLFVPGLVFTGTWSSSTAYKIGQAVSHGGNTFIAVQDNSNQNPDANPTYWSTLVQGTQWESTYAGGTAYQKNDLVKYGNGVYIAKTNTSGNLPTNSTYWDQFVANDGMAANDVYYVTPTGNDTNVGTSIAAAFASIKAACAAAAATGNPSTIKVSAGTYTEVCPITVPANVAIVGDNQRTVNVQPTSGTNTTTMFLMSNGSLLNKMTFKGMTGWVPGATAANVTTSTIAGVVVRLNPDSPITTKSPYVIECAAICTGAIGALVDGTVHATGAKTMIFHGYTVISDNGIGFWIKDGGKAEIVSCFTYYCYFGYTCSGGGHIRSLNGNNSYGTWGATARGFDSAETPITGTLVGEQLPFAYGGGTIAAGDTVSNGAGATATVTNVQYTANKVYIKSRSGTFANGNALTFTSGGTGTCTGAAENQKGFALVATGFSALPKPGASVSITGDAFSYVVQATTNTWVNSSSEIVLLLAQEKPTGSAAGTAVTIRYKYSQVRLTGHDFLSIGTGGTTTTNYPGIPTQASAQGNEVDEDYPGRVFYVSTDQDGNFRVGEYFKIDQATGKATLNASAFDLSGLSSLRLGSIGAQLGEQINEFSSDATLSGNSNLAVPTEAAVKTYVDNAAPVGSVQIVTSKTKAGYLPCDGTVYTKSSYPALATALGSIDDPRRWGTLEDSGFWNNVNFATDNFRFHSAGTTDTYVYKYYPTDSQLWRSKQNDQSALINVNSAVNQTGALTPYSNASHSHHATAMYKDRYFVASGNDAVNGRAAFHIYDTTTGSAVDGRLTQSGSGGNAKVWANENYLVICDPSNVIDYTSATPSTSITYSSVGVPANALYGALIGSKFIFSPNNTWTTAYELDLTTGTTTTIQTHLNGQSAIVQGVYAVSNDKYAVIHGTTPNSFMLYCAADRTFSPLNVPDLSRVVIARSEFHNGLFMICGYYNDQPSTGSFFIPFIWASTDAFNWINLGLYRFASATAATNLPAMPIIGNEFIGIRPATTMSDSTATIYVRYPYNRSTQFMTPIIPNQAGAYPLIKT